MLKLATEPLRHGTQQWLEAEVKRYVASGDYDSDFAGWPGDNFVDVAQNATRRLRTALVEETIRRVDRIPIRMKMPENLHLWSRTKLSPMVDGLFSADQRSIVLNTLASSIVFLTPHNIASVLADQRWLSTAWDLANLYLTSMGAPVLSQDACHIVGLSEETMCFVSMSYFEEADPFADFVVHEAAHVFHNCKRATVGLNESRRKEYLLDIDYAKRETFAYACEAYSRITSMTTGVRQREEALKRHANGAPPPDDRVDHDEYLDILGEAVRVRNGWQRILKRCAPVKHRRPTERR
ncbi:hypothetical protein AWB82_04178 [Caballeronia glebae]|uniref:Uncharacterized protein n=1 Tax=Caballeronia glebae TaxID=1777143 RepID=A0A158BK40_9BURK|nr:hypothetical protein [Caballeronia glebae]SAK70116.1 hypothetical protein AWB82_04178 [Caballeronia glebae]